MQRQEGFAEVNGAQIYYQVAGQGHPLVLVHAGVADHTMWDAQFDLFAERFRVIRYDFRGFGKSSMPNTEFSGYKDLNGLLEFLAIDRAYLIGVSMGGSTIIDFALSYPAKAAAIIPVAAGISGKQASETDKALFAKMDEAYEAHDLERVLEMELELWLVGPRRSPDKVATEIKDHFRRMERNNLQQEFGRTEGIPKRMEPPAIERLAEINIPALFIVGDEDVQGTIENADIFAAQVPGATKVVLPNVAHLPPMEVPDEFNRLALDFLNHCEQDS